MNAVPALHLRTPAPPEIAELRALLPDDALLVGEAEVRRHAGHPAGAPEHAPPMAVALPEDVGQVQRVVRWAARHRVPLLPRGVAGAGPAAGAARGIVLSLERLATIRELNATGRYAVVEAGVVGATLAREAARLGLHPPGGPADSTIGTDLAGHPGGRHCVRYGVTTDDLLGLELVLADGRLVHTRGHAPAGPEGTPIIGGLPGLEPAFSDGQLAHTLAGPAAHHPPHLATDSDGAPIADVPLMLELHLSDGKLIHTPALRSLTHPATDPNGARSAVAPAIVTAATLRLRPLPGTEPTAFTATFTAGFDDLRAAGAALAAIARQPGGPGLLEILDRAALDTVREHRVAGLDGTCAALLIGQAEGEDARRLVAETVRLCREQGATSMTMSGSADGARELLGVRRAAGAALLGAGAATVVADLAVPPGRLVEMLGHIERAGRGGSVRIATVGHAADGALHPVLILPDQAPATWREARRKAGLLRRRALDLGGRAPDPVGPTAAPRSPKSLGTTDPWPARISGCLT
ncbi:FAD-binding oxidoreductase [Kitasatospora sp. NPDC096147]|uniref:FAD-binding oxidoreductase n=1 Tax=Kitasatospora sp. NPDC096147 TaxID=3364093 RepID=UPI003809A481